MLHDVTRPLPAIEAEDNQTLAISLQLGTRLLAPLHVIPNGLSVDQLDLTLLIGACYLARLDATAVTAEALEAAGIPANVERLLLCTRNSSVWARDEAQPPTTFVELTPEAADWIVQRGVRLLGSDAPLVASAAQPASAYILFGAEVVVAVGLALGALAPGSYTLYCLPLPVVGTDAAPCRILLSDEGCIRPS
jgi:arylformamidase